MDPRFGMHDTTREYACEQLVAAGELGLVLERLLTWCIGYAETMEQDVRGRRQRSAIAKLGIEHDNLRAVLSWALGPASKSNNAARALRLAAALARFWSSSGFVAEGRARRDAVHADARTDQVRRCGQCERVHRALAGDIHCSVRQPMAPNTEQVLTMHACAEVCR